VHVVVFGIDGDEYANNKVDTVVAFRPEEGHEVWNETETVHGVTVYINVENVITYSVGPGVPKSSNLDNLEFDDEDADLPDTDEDEGSED